MIVIDFPRFSSHESSLLTLLSPVFRRTPLSILNLVSQPTRAIVSVLGVAFALLLIFMQLGFRGAVGNTATIVYGQMRGDLIMRSPDYVHLYEPRTIDRAWMNLAASHPDIERVDPFFISLNKWQNPPKNAGCANAPPDGSFRTVAMMGVQLDSKDCVIQIQDLERKLEQLKDPDAMLIDDATRAEYGPDNCKKFSQADIGKYAELGGRNTRIAGVFHLGTGLATSGAVLLSDVAFGRRALMDVRHRASLGLIQIKAGCDPNKVCDALNKWLRDQDPSSEMSVQVITMEEQMRLERRRWLDETPLGTIFTMGVFISFIIGSAIVYMVLATDVASRLPEYATLKAMGYTPFFVAKTVLRQAWLLALVGFVPAFLASMLLYWVTATFSGIPTFMTTKRVVGVFGLSFLMCTIAGLLAIRKLWKAEPASLF
jgi:putative ABC transport system permease protein